MAADLRGLSKTNRGAYVWSRRFNGKIHACGLGPDPTIAERIVPELNRMLEEDGATIEELRQYVKDQSYNPLVGLTKNHKGQYTWQRRFNGKHYSCGIGTDPATVKRIVPELNRMLEEDGATIEELRQCIKDQSYNPLAGLSKKHHRAHTWQRRFNGKIYACGLSSDLTIAKRIVPELNRMLEEDGATIEELRQYVKDQTYNPLAGLSKAVIGSYIWQRRFNGKNYLCGLGSDQTIAERIVPELNRMLEEDGVTIEELRQYVAEQLAVEQMPDLSHLKPPKPKKGVKPAFDWLP